MTPIEFVKSLEDTYGKEYPVGMKKVIISALGNIKNYKKLFKLITENQSASKWWRMPPDLSAIADYLWQCREEKIEKKIHPKVIMGECVKCGCNYEVVIDEKKSYECPGCKYNPRYEYDKLLERMKVTPKNWRSQKKE